MMLMTNDLIRIAAAGGGMVLDSKKIMINDLIRIAAASSSGTGKIILNNVNGILVDDLIRISAAGKGNIIFNFN